MLFRSRDPSVYGGRIDSRQAMERYFFEYYSAFRSRLDFNIPPLSKKMTQLLFVGRNDQTSFFTECKMNRKISLPLFNVTSMRTAAEFFKVIDSPTTAVIVPYGEEGKAIIADLNGDVELSRMSSILRMCQRYTVNLFAFELEKLSASGGLVSFFDGRVLALKDAAYSEYDGVNFGNDSELDLYYL